MEEKTFSEKVNRLMNMYNDGSLGGDMMPEDRLQHVVRENDLLNVLTLGMCLNYQRSAYSLWEAVAQAYQDSRTRWIFDPVTVAQKGIDELQEALVLHKVALQPKRHPDIWQRVSKGTVHSSEQGNVLGLLDSVNFDIGRLKKIMQGTRKSEFPYLSGPKLFNYWLHILELRANVIWKSPELITIAPDTHVLKATVKLGLCSPDVLKGRASDRIAVASAWEDVLSESHLAPIDLHTPLWLWSRAGFPELK